MSDQPSAFREWFEAQHGPRPGGLAIDEDLDLSRLEGDRAASILHARAAYDARLESALYAWQIADAQKSLEAVRAIVGKEVGR